MHDYKKIRKKGTWPMARSWPVAREREVGRNREEKEEKKALIYMKMELKNIFDTIMKKEEERTPRS